MNWQSYELEWTEVEEQEQKDWKRKGVDFLL